MSLAAAVPDTTPGRWNSQTWVSNGRRYATALVSTLVVVWVRMMLHPWLNEECPFSLFYLSVLLTAWMVGTGPAVFAIGLGTLSAAHFFIPPASSLLIESVPDLVQLMIYLFVNCVAIYLFDRAERQRSLAENRSRENERLSNDLRQADVRKDEFLALLAHELRNPLAPIRSSLALLERKDSPEVARRMRDIIQRQTGHLVRITDDLLDVSRFCRGKVELKICRMDLRLAVDDAVEMIECSFQSKYQRLSKLIPSEPIWVDGDRVRLAQLTANLLGNASKYTPDSGRITLNVEQIDDTVSITVSDNGIGFDASHADRIIDPFVQIDTSRTREYGGLGVGLTIVDRLISLHHGTLAAFSRGPGMGSRFTVTLPAAIDARLNAGPNTQLNAGPNSQPNVTTKSRDQADSDETFDASCDAAKATFLNGSHCPAVDPQRGRTLLLVEDNVDASAILIELLESEGFCVHPAYDGIEAIQKAVVVRPEVIIMDIGLPGMDGYETARRIRRLPELASCKLVALTGWGAQADREMAIEAGFDLHLTKPVAFRELLETVESMIKLRSEVDVSPRASMV